MSHTTQRGRMTRRFTRGVVSMALTLSACSKPTNTPVTPIGDGDDVTPPQHARTFSSSDDWAAGSYDGVNADNPGQLQMNVGLNLRLTPYTWVPNSGAPPRNAPADQHPDWWDVGTVTRISTQTPFPVAGPYLLNRPTDVPCWNPSRTTVDADFDVWVGCRGISSYRNREIAFDGSNAGFSPDMVPDITCDQEKAATTRCAWVDNKVVKLNRETGEVLMSIKVGNGPRALALDRNNHLWVGCSVDDTVWEVDGATGHCYRGERADCDGPVIQVSDFPYGALVDQRGHLWVLHVYIAKVTEIEAMATDEHTPSDGKNEGEIIGVYGPWPRTEQATDPACNGQCGAPGACRACQSDCTTIPGGISIYGIAVDHHNDIWMGGFSCNDVIKVKGVTGPYFGDGDTYRAGDLVAHWPVGGSTSRGVAVDLDDNVWVASSGSSTASKIDGVTGVIIQTIQVGIGPIGVGVDAYGNAWVVNYNSDSVRWINGLDADDWTEIKVGFRPYTYSDMLGSQLHQITLGAKGVANWLAEVDSELADPVWESVHWTATEPPGTNVTIRTRCAAKTSADPIERATWSDFLDASGPILCAGHGKRYLQVEARFYAQGTTASPVLYDLTVYWH